MRSALILLNLYGREAGQRKLKNILSVILSVILNVILSVILNVILNAEINGTCLEVIQ